MGHLFGSGGKWSRGHVSAHVSTPAARDDNDDDDDGDDDCVRADDCGDRGGGGGGDVSGGGSGGKCCVLPYGKPKRAVVARNSSSVSNACTHKTKHTNGAERG